MTDEQFKFYDDIYHPQTGGYPSGPIFEQAYQDYLAGRFDPQAAMKALSGPYYCCTADFGKHDETCPNYRKTCEDCGEVICPHGFCVCNEASEPSTCPDCAKRRQDEADADREAAFQRDVMGPMLGLSQGPCPDCGGNGRQEVTLDMAIDAGERQMAGQTITCTHCGGDGWILVEMAGELRGRGLTR